MLNITNIQQFQNSLVLTFYRVPVKDHYDKLRLCIENSFREKFKMKKLI